MKRVVCLMLFLVCLISTLASAQDEADAAVRSKVLALEKAWNQAYKLGDTKALAAILDPNIVLIEDDGSLKTRAEFLATVKAATSNEEQVMPETLTVHVFGKTAIAVGVIGVKGKSGVRRERFIDTWIEKNGTWVCVATDATPITHAGS
ncbi:MAG: nuclear transport factor 2 family protein [Acidobacteriia bacterium]|nr:nuclear transport factor 2 family protein [Terriglobia bacterium]